MVSATFEAGESRLPEGSLRLRGGVRGYVYGGSGAWRGCATGYIGMGFGERGSLRRFMKRSGLPLSTLSYEAQNRPSSTPPSFTATSAAPSAPSSRPHHQSDPEPPSISLSSPALALSYPQMSPRCAPPVSHSHSPYHASDSDSA